MLKVDQHRTRSPSRLGVQWLCPIGPAVSRAGYESRPPPTVVVDAVEVGVEGLFLIARRCVVVLSEIAVRANRQQVARYDSEVGEERLGHVVVDLAYGADTAAGALDRAVEGLFVHRSARMVWPHPLFVHGDQRLFVVLLSR